MSKSGCHEKFHRKLEKNTLVKLMKQLVDLYIHLHQAVRI